jgi:hypothetical protein
MRYKLLQIKDWEHNPYIFRGFDIAQKHSLSLKDYEVVYEGEVEGPDVETILEKLFTLFNILYPEDFEGRSMSVSDVVELEGVYYYCDHIGFKKITEFCS